MRWKDITERVEARYPTPYGYWNLFKNPSKTEMRNLRGHLRQDEELPTGVIRALLDADTGDLYAWDGYYGAHGGIADRLGLTNYFHLMLEDNKIRVLTMWRYERRGYTMEDVYQMLATNPNVSRLYPPRVNIFIEP